MKYADSSWLAPGPSLAAWGLGLLHALVDMASLAVLYYEVCLFGQRGQTRFDQNDVLFAILLYNVLAFGLQAPLGWLADRLGAHQRFAAAGLGLTALAVATSSCWFYAGVIVIGVGNACFHIGGGGIVLRDCGGRAARPGIFVAPGAMGVALGIALGLAGFPYRAALAATAAAFAVVLVLVRLSPARPAPCHISSVAYPVESGGQPNSADKQAGSNVGLPVGAVEPSRSKTAGIHTTVVEKCDDENTDARGHSRSKVLLAICVLLLLLSVSVRSLVGGAVRGGWPEQTGAIALALAGAAVAGKLFGGAIADRLGWRKVGVGALLLAAPLVWAGAGVSSLDSLGAWFAPRSPAFLMIDTLLIQLTMALTLTGVFVAMPRHPGLAFGLPSAALLIGAEAPKLARYFSIELAPWLVPLILASAVMIYLGLTVLRRAARA